MVNAEIIEDIGNIYIASFKEANRVLEQTETDIAFECDKEDVRAVASSIFIEYCKRISPQYKGTQAQHSRGNNDDNPASKAQINLIKTLVMAGGAPAESAMQNFRDAYGLEAKPNMAELQELRMGQASDIITKLKEDKRRKENVY